MGEVLEHPIPTMKFDRVYIGYGRILEEIFDDLNISIVRKEWQSKYNDYVVYDYEPFTVDGFDLRYYCQSDSIQNLDFATYLIEKRINEVEQLEKCL